MPPLEALDGGFLFFQGLLELCQLVLDELRGAHRLFLPALDAFLDEEGHKAGDAQHGLGGVLVQEADLEEVGLPAVGDLDAQVLPHPRHHDLVGSVLFLILGIEVQLLDDLQKFGTAGQLLGDGTKPPLQVGCHRGFHVIGRDLGGLDEDGGGAPVQVGYVKAVEGDDRGDDDEGHENNPLSSPHEIEYVP